MTADSPAAMPAQPPVQAQPAQPPAPAGRPRPARRRLLDRVLLRVRVAAVEPLARRTQRIVLAGDPLVGLDWVPGQSVNVFLADPTALASWRHGVRDLKRTYSVWDYDPSGRLELAVYDHGGESPGASWSRTVQPGDDVIVTKPDGHLVARAGAPLHLFAGDDTAAVPLGAILRSLPDTARTFAVFECDEPADEIALALPAASAPTWVHRHGASAASSALLPAAVAALDLPAEPGGVAYVAGEARTVQAVRDHLVNDRGWPRRDVLTQPFWTPGKRGLD